MAKKKKVQIGKVQSKRSKKKSSFERIYHILGIIGWLTLIFFSIIGIQLFLAALKYYP